MATQPMSDPTPQGRSNGATALIVSATGLVGAIAGLLTALSPIGSKLLTKPKDCLVAASTQAPPPISEPAPAVASSPEQDFSKLPFTALRSNRDSDANANAPKCKEKAYNTFKDHGASNINIGPGTAWVQANDHGTQVIVFCVVGGVDKMVVATGPNPKEATDKAVTIQGLVFE